MANLLHVRLSRTDVVYEVEGRVQDLTLLVRRLLLAIRVLVGHEIVGLVSDFLPSLLPTKRNFRCEKNLCRRKQKQKLFFEKSSSRGFWDGKTKTNLVLLETLSGFDSILGVSRLDAGEIRRKIEIKVKFRGFVPGVFLARLPLLQSAGHKTRRILPFRGHSNSLGHLSKINKSGIL